MTKFIVFLVCVAKLTAMVESAVSIYEHEKKPEEFKNEEGCYLTKLGRVLPVQERYSPINGECKQYLCKSNDGITQEFSCGAVDVKDNCKKTEGDLSKPYPACCPEIACVSKNPPTIEAPEVQQTDTAQPAVAPANDSGAEAADGADAVACAGQGQGEATTNA